MQHAIIAIREWKGIPNTQILKLHTALCIKNEPVCEQGTDYLDLGVKQFKKMSCTSISFVGSRHKVVEIWMGSWKPYAAQL